MKTDKEITDSAKELNEKEVDSIDSILNAKPIKGYCIDCREAVINGEHYIKDGGLHHKRCPTIKK